MIELRPYQREATAALWKWLSENDGNPIVVASVGAGKSIMMAQFIKDCVEDWPETRIILATHSAELVKQDFAKLMAIYPQAKAGIYSAGLKKRQIKSQIIVGSIQSLWKKAYNIQDPPPNLLIVDEAHTISRKDKTMWGKFIADLKVINPDIRVIGYSGTHWRLDSGYLHEGEGRLFDGIAFEIGMIELIEQGYLCPLVTLQPKAQIDLSNVHIRGGEYVADELEDAADAITEAAVDEIVSAGRGRKAWLAFCSGKRHAFHVRDAIRARGITSETIVAETPADEREIILNRLRTGQLRSVTNVSTLTTGVDVPCIDMIAFLRPTMSSGLFTQMCGRGARTSPGKVDCLCLDHSGLIAEHGPVDQAKPKNRRKKDGPGDAPKKVCPTCEASVAASARECPDCGHTFPPPVSKIDQTASTLAILSSAKQPDAVPTWVDVSRVSYARHTKEGSPDSIRVTYQCGLLQHSEWLCLEHDGGMKAKAGAWWRKRAQGDGVPSSVIDALPLTRYLLTPKQIAVRPSKKDPRYIEITGHRFEDAA